MKDKIKLELKKLFDDCKYTAETHYTIASRSKTIDFWSRLIPAVLTASLSVIEVAFEPESQILIILASAVTTATTNVLGAKEKYESHNNAGRKFTRLKKLCSKTLVIDSEYLTETELNVTYDSLLCRYLDAIDETPPTENWAFGKAQIRIQKDKVHEPD